MVSANQNIASSVITATAKNLATQLAALTKQTVAQVQPFADRYAPAVARWGVELAAATAAKDQAGIDKYNDDFKLITDDAVLAAADFGIVAQSEAEQAFFAILESSGKFAVSLA